MGHIITFDLVEIDPATNKPFISKHTLRVIGSATEAENCKANLEKNSRVKSVSITIEKEKTN